MANYTLEFSFQFTDVNGDSAVTRIQQVVADTQTLAVLNTTSTNLAAALSACTNAKLTARTTTVIQDRAQISAATAPPPASATYPSVTDGAQLNFANAAGEKRKLTVPAPLLSDFITHSNVVNASDTNIAALITVVEGVVDFDGATNIYEGGIKVAHHARRRVTRKSL